MIEFLKKNQSWFSCLLLLSLTAIFFGFSFGYERVNPTFVEWLFHDDQGEHYFGWAFFRKDPWGFPIGEISSYGYPISSMIGITDSIPLLAVPLKLLRSFLPEPFQYFGLWIALNCFLQSISGFFLAKKWGANALQQVLFGLLILMAPIYIFRMNWHMALTTHWPLVLGMGLVGESISNLKVKWAFRILIFITAMVHPYLWAMMVVVFYFHHWNSARKIFNKNFFIEFGKIFVVCLIAWLLIGALGQSKVMMQGIGGFSSNLNTFVNAFGTSSFLPSLPTAFQGQGEGYAYLGLGGLLWIGVALGVWIRGLFKKTLSSEEKKKIRERLIFFGLVFCISSSFIFTLNESKVLDLYKPVRLTGIMFVLSVFYATGRFVWIIWYGLMMGAFVFLFRKIPSRIFTALLLVVVGLQFFDLRPVFNLARHRPDETAHTKWMNSEHWQKICEGKKHLYFFPYEYDIRWIRYAYDCHATLNAVFTAREPRGRSEAFQKSFQDLLSGNVSEDSVYLARGEAAEKAKQALSLLKEKPKLKIESYDGYLVVTK